MPKRIYPATHADPDLQQLIDDFEEWRSEYNAAGDDEGQTLMNAWIAGAMAAAHDVDIRHAAIRVQAEANGVIPPHTFDAAAFPCPHCDGRLRHADGCLTWALTPKP